MKEQDRGGCWVAACAHYRLLRANLPAGRLGLDGSLFAAQGAADLQMIGYIGLDDGASQHLSIKDGPARCEFLIGRQTTFWETPPDKSASTIASAPGAERGT
jgi:hypothetical protein